MKRPVGILLSFFLALASLPAAQADPFFGTGVGFDSNFYSRTTGVTEAVAFGQITLGQRQADVTADNVFGQARARATTTAGGFSLGAGADSIGAPYSRQAWSFAASGFSVTGTPQSFVNLIFTFDGGIFAGPPRDRGSAGLWIYAAGDGNGGPLAYLDFTLGDQGSFFVNINDSFGSRSFQVGNQPNLSLSAAIPVNGGPFLAALLTDSQGANVDFFNTVTLTGAELPRGATLTLDTGQVFQSGLAVPEPGTFILLAIGVAGLAATRRRKTAYPLCWRQLKSLCLCIAGLFIWRAAQLQPASLPLGER